MNAVKSKNMLIAMLLITLIAIAVPASLWAAGTTAGTVITNTVNVNYTIGGAGASTSAQSTFTVDTIVRLTVVSQDASYVASAPSATAQLLTFVVTNTSNTVFDFALSAPTTSDPFTGLADTFDANGVFAFHDVNGDGVFTSGTDTLFINELATDATATVYISADMPGGVTAGDIAAYLLSVTAHQSDGAGTLGGSLTDGGAYNGTIVVFADGLADGTADATISDAGAYRITVIGVTKTATVYSDPVGSGRPIPGAIVTYTVVITNPSGGVDATNVSITDTIPAGITFVGALGTPQAFVDGTTNCVSAAGCTATDCGIVVDNTCYTNGNDGGTPNVQYTGTAVDISGMTLVTGATTTIKYQVQVNN